MSQEYHTDGAEPQQFAVITSYTDIEETEVEWLWPNRIPYGKLTITAGDPDVGKSWTALSMTATVTSGGRWPDGSGTAERGSVLIVSAEDDPSDTLKPRLRVLGADMSRVHHLEGIAFEDKPDDISAEFCFGLHMDTLNDIPDLRLVIFDTLSHFTGTADMNTAHESKRSLRPLTDWARERGVAVVAIEHTNKDSSKRGIHRLLGSIGIAGQARYIHVVGKHHTDPAKRYFVKLKGNCGPEVRGMEFEFRDSDDGKLPTLAWSLCDEDISAEMVLNGPPKERAAPQRDEAESFLEDLLSNGQERLADEIFTHAKEEGFTDKTVRHAARKLKIEKRKEGFGGPWWWSLPKDAPKMPTENRGVSLASMERMEDPILAIRSKDAPLNTDGNNGQVCDTDESLEVEV